MIREVGVIDKKIGSFRALPKIEGMQALHSGGKLEDPRRGVDFKNTPAICAILGDFEFLSQLIKR